MLKQHIVCLCMDKEHCNETTREIAEENNTANWFVEPVYAPLSSQLIYRGTIITES